MPVEYRTGNLFDFPGNLAHGTNGGGAMGKGIAKDFKKNFPSMYNEYVDMCKTGRHMLGMVFPFKEISVTSNAGQVYAENEEEINKISTGEVRAFRMNLSFTMKSRIIYNLCIKPHWKMKAEDYAVRACLKKMCEHAVASREERQSGQEAIANSVVSFSPHNELEIAMPALGCGLGGLDWETEVKPIIEEIGSQTPCTLIVYLQEEATTKNESHIDPHDADSSE